MHPQSRVQMNKAHEVVTTGSPKQSGIPRAMVLTVYFVIFPVTGLSCHRRRRGVSGPLGPTSPFANLASASGCQNHTTSPSALTRSSHALTASIASRFTFRDDCAYAPPVEAG